MPRIAWIEDDVAEGATADVFAMARAASPRGRLPDIMRTLSLRPDFLEPIMAASHLHFSDGALSRAQHEMIASYVSALTKCHY